MSLTTILIAVGTLILGGVLGYYLRRAVSMSKRDGVELQIKQKMISAKEEAQNVIDKSKKKADEIYENLQRDKKTKEQEFKKTEERFIKKGEFLDTRQVEIDKAAENITSKAEEIKKIREEAESLKQEQATKLEQVANLSQKEAKEKLLETIKQNSAEDLVVRMQKLENETKEKLDRRAKEILTTVIQRLATSTTQELTSTTISIPSEDIKGKIIGKEGRNIRAFERETGVEVLIDETPETVMISSFDPIRRQIARLALENLIIDRRIQPAKIEEKVKQAKEEINQIIKEKGEQAVYECGVFNLDPRIIDILGRLYFRTSYGQNVLQHSIEMAHLAGMLAQELEADVNIAKAGALVHDIGKALDHEVQGTHLEIGIRILQKFGADPKIIQAMKSHHDDYPHETIEAVIVQVADVISGSRPGARRDTVENYLKRMTELEAIINEFEEVEKSYAISAGREIRVFVKPTKINDLEVKNLARDIAIKIEQGLSYPGEIKVTVIRETRIIDYAR